MTFALGRPVAWHDMPTLRAIVRDAQPQQWRLSALIEGIVNSPAFLTDRLPADSAPQTRTAQRH
jgi:hypothetical protein